MSTPTFATGYGPTVAAPPATDAFRIGSGAGFAGDRYDAAEVLARFGDLDALAFECLAERTIGIAQHRRSVGTEPGWDARILRRLSGTLPALLAPGRRGAGRPAPIVTTNAGAADPSGAARAIVELLAKEGLPRVPVAAVTGDDVLAVLDLRESRILGKDDTLWDIRDRIVSANAYIGAAPLVEGLARGARIIVTGRSSDAALFLAPLAHHHGWDLNATPVEGTALDLIAEGTLVGHLLECAGQLTGGYFADGASKQVEGLARLGFPFADVRRDGSATYGKVPGTGGVLDRRTVLEQLLYEIDDPFHYPTPDVTLDLSAVEITELPGDRVLVRGGRANGVPEQLKVSVGVKDGLVATAEIGYAGFGSAIRAELAAAIIRERWAEVPARTGEELSIAFIGVNSSRPWFAPDPSEPPEVRVRFSVRTWERSVAVALCEEVEALYTNGPSGGGGVTSQIRDTIGIVSTLVPRGLVSPSVEVLA
ncbi:acyclic terpene utilization AtuA family protein [Microbacterium saperdae]